MSGLKNGLLAAAIALVPITSMAQQKVDFSGRWSSVQPPAQGGRGAPPGTMGSGWGDEINIKHADGWLAVEALIFASGDLQPPLRYRYALNGSRHRNRIVMGYGIQEFESRTAWKGDTLLITTVHPFRHPDTGSPMQAEVVQALSLTGGNSLTRAPSLVVELRIPGVLGGPPSTTRTVFTRK